MSTDPSPARLPLPLRAAETTPERPWPVRHLAPKIADYVARMPPVWVEGQVLNLKRWNTMYFLTLRDSDLDMSLSVTAPASAIRRLGDAAADGAHVVVHASPRFHAKKGDLTFQADDVRLVGLGELLARIEHLKGVLAAEGLFDQGRKRPLPFLPAVVGLVCAQQGDAEHDVVSNARARWPGVRFEIRRVTVQGPRAVPEVSAAIADLDADPRVEVVVVARGGGSFEDLLPFSNETLVRAAAACRTPLVSAIGHHMDTPLLDLVADFRASTPTDAAKRVVPDVTEERARVLQLRQRSRGALVHRLTREQAGLDHWRSRPALANPTTLVDTHEARVQVLRDAARRALHTELVHGRAEVAGLAAQVRALSPAATLDRGYAVVQRDDGHVVRDPADVAPGDALRVRVARGELAAQVVAP
ncbi:exodeoxyribonuclease VII large subunit [Cellulomonas fimi]|uniref:Exodeoxyribonuclease 7 large subunit n=1 Tax=Cellulomonas fimi (strain ATCC 484 / DSM 20113 / JCM 1341 / CCUG 24087 / LMG 16345 / NBRC 15513 / NCIMB 8980 / NCTC 7547 / NRS-133) TaxID=590998 RepID=F4H8N2_CELFA|nr:exodeoxyribonuclease VII large subunit [Cellulomonas fimi]AEE47040.1 exodeoxyribonuclease VII, large subunit [Cellulomonas fimi ATCC 484]VEH34937.1 Exodeoxyribonuclease 7 large subunit [Cellulomonas fimi]